MKEICSKCGKAIEYNSNWSYRVIKAFNRNISSEKRKFYSSYAWQNLRDSKVKEHLIV